MESQAAVLDAPLAEGSFAENDAVTCEPVTVPDPVGEEVLVSVATASLCHTDVAIARGHLDEQYPLVMGHEGAGVVEAVGGEVESVAPGDHVVFGRVACGRCEPCRAGNSHLCHARRTATPNGTLRTGEVRFRRDGDPVHHCHGVSSFTEHTLVTEEVAIPITEAVPLREAPLLGCGVFTGVGAVLNTADVEMGSSLVVFGAGGVGLSAVQAADIAGARDVVVVDVIPEKLELATDLGATHTVDASERDPTEAIPAMLDAEVDYAFDTAGRIETLEAALAVVGTRGTAVAVGTPGSGTDAVEFSVTDLVTSEKRLLGSFNGSYNLETAIPKIADLVAQGRFSLSHLITDAKPLGGVDRAMDELVAGSQIRQLIQP
jgi:Zn-dependent alcohol dehydrogenase